MAATHPLQLRKGTRHPKLQLQIHKPISRAGNRRGRVKGVLPALSAFPPRLHTPRDI